MAEQRFRVTVVMERVAVANRWIAEKWQPLEVVACDQPASDATGPDRRPLPESIAQPDGSTRSCWPGFEIEIHRSEAEGYWLNVTAPEPKVFIGWRLEEGVGRPYLVTASYNEAARWLDGGEQVDSVPMPAELFACLGGWVAANYRPEPRKKVRRNDPFQEGAFRREGR